VFDYFIAFVDKLKNGGAELINWIWQNTVGKVRDVVSNMIGNTASGVFDKLKDIVLAPFHTIGSVLSSAYHSIQSAISFLPAPLQIILLITLAGAMTLGVIWVLKRLYELL